MNKPFVSAIVAAADNNVIGKDNQLLWHLPNDLRFFKRTTSGHTILMGRKTYESVGKPLPNRRNLVITRQKDYVLEGAEVVHSLEEAMARCTGEGEVFVVGGAEIYRQALPLTNRVYLTRVHAEPPGDSYFPDLDEQDWVLVSAEEHDPDEKHAYGYTFQVYERM
ncbi:dihydrofolate reductase [Parapedobacter defluvii]|uniref:Dihydrofolate reductase n=1 Tax=Parapedobacter defluvii TaxID=2045106 RepID=A0ABQ1MXR5_9SPHI|nr:dihydrofolate reductase [Parapedobacter defluvii]RQP16547.1 MAG: dihydrofolate reductase [Parapedobacter sp.]GGC49071.1 dihydrofolate reductase [Parapedobacter defluvii]